MSNLFTATEEWYDATETEAKAFLELWQRASSCGRQHRDIVERYPQHFAVEEQEDIDWMIEFMQGDNDWFVESVYLDQDWVDAEIKVWELMKTLTPDNPNVLPPMHHSPLRDHRRGLARRPLQHWAWSAGPDLRVRHTHRRQFSTASERRTDDRSTLWQQH